MVWIIWTAETPNSWSPDFDNFSLFSCLVSKNIYQNNRTNYYFFNLRKVDNSNKWKNYVIVTRVKLSVKLDALVVQSIFI